MSWKASLEEIRDRDWSTAFTGWSDAAIAAHGGGVSTPTELVRAIFETRWPR